MSWLSTNSSRPSLKSLSLSRDLAPGSMQHRKCLQRVRSSSSRERGSDAHLEILSILGSASQAQIRTVLLQVVKPAFERTAQNERLKSETATKINRAINVEPMYHAEEDNIWKDRPGLVDIILWCLDSLQVPLIWTSNPFRLTYIRNKIGTRSGHCSSHLS